MKLPPAHDHMTISMVLIAKDEGNNVQPCFDSFWDDVDEVILVDTGSTDGTDLTARKYAEDKGEPEKLIIAKHEWQDDFGAARRYGDSLATGDWLSWADLDDTVEGMAHLRKLGEEAGPQVNGFFCLYEYAINDEGVCVCELYRERLVRRGAGEWIDRVHESQVIHGMIVKVDPANVRWKHRRPPFDSSDRNMKILVRWLDEEPNHARALMNLGRDYMAGGEYAKASPLFERYLRGAQAPPELRAQTYRHLCVCLYAEGKFAWAAENAFKALAECPQWPDTYLSLAELMAAGNDHQKAVFYAEQVVRLGAPDTLLIVNPREYDARPYALIAQSLAATGQIAQACKVAEDLLERVPGYLNVQDVLAEWQMQRQQEQTAGMWAQCADMLINYDEPLKANELLKTVPHYATDHPLVVAARVKVRDVLAEPYQIEPVLENTPRGRFLLTGIAEQTS